MVAEQRATQLASQLGAALTLIHVSEDDRTSDEPGAHILEAAEERARVLGVDAVGEHRRGGVAASIMAVAAELPADLLVIGDHGMGSAKRFSLGGIPSQVAHHSPTDILVVRTADRQTRLEPYTKVLLATDGSLTAHQATRRGNTLAQSLGAEVTLIYVGDKLIGDIVLRDTSARLGDEEMKRIVVTGRPVAQISKSAGDHDLVVVGNKGMVGSRRYIERVVPWRVANEAPCDVLIVKTVGRFFYDLRPGEGAVVDLEGERIAAYIHEDGTKYMMSARCQHMGCIVGWNSRALTWDCPCHGSRYDYSGAVINGPTKKPLPPVTI